MKVIPHHPTTTSVTLWISAGPAERSWSVEVRARGTGSTVHGWSAARRPDRKLPNVIAGLPAYCVWRHAVDGLVPDAAYDVYVVPTIRPKRLVARFDTLPRELPLRILAASCYSVDNDMLAPGTWPMRLPAAVRTGRLAVLLRKVRLWVRMLLSILPRRGSSTLLQGGVAERYRALYDDPATRPHLKVLMGDQVYLDAPPGDFLHAGIPPAALERKVARSYQRSWEVLGEFLTLGANVCVSDDHEFWNDYPDDPAFFCRTLHDATAREAFERAAHDHLRWMQLARPTWTLTVGRRGSGPRLAVFVADTRIHRTRATHECPGFMDHEDLDALLAWIEELRCPGVLFLGQPLIAPVAGPFDDNLRSYPRQYQQLSCALTRAAHDVVVVCGDSHFGRVATIEMPHSGRRHVEVISSPLSVLEGAEDSVSTGLPPDLDDFPPGADGPRHSGVARWVNGVPGRSGGTYCEDHAMLLEFASSDDGGVAFTVGAYLMRHLDGRGRPQRAWTESFELR